MFSAVQKACKMLQSGGLVGIVDDWSSTPSLYITCCARDVVEKNIIFLISEARGVVCVAISEEHRRELRLPLMIEDKTPSNSAQFDFTVSVEARREISTGISAADRTRTIHVLANTENIQQDLVSPGHIFPVRAFEGGILVRAAIPEAIIDLLSLAKQPKVGAFSHCLSTNGALLSPSEQQDFLQKYSIPSVSLSELVRYRLSNESLVRRASEAKVPSSFASNLRAVCYTSTADNAEHLALVSGDIEKCDKSGLPEIISVRVHVENPLADIFGIKSIAHRSIEASLRAVAHASPGVFVYIRHPEREILRQSFAEHTYRPSSSDTLREIGIGAQILSDLGVRRARVFSRASRNFHSLRAFQIDIVEQVLL